MKDQKKRNQKVLPARGNDYALIIDSKPHVSEEGILYLGAGEMSKSGLLNQGRFSSCTIRNTDVDEIRPSALLGLFTALKPGSKVEVVLSNPILVMQPYEAKMVEANAKLAGFEQIRCVESGYYDEESRRRVETTNVTFVKPYKA